MGILEATLSVITINVEKIQTIYSIRHEGIVEKCYTEQESSSTLVSF